MAAGMRADVSLGPVKPERPEDLLSARLRKQESEGPRAAPAGVTGTAQEAGGCWEVRPSVTLLGL